MSKEVQHMFASIAPAYDRTNSVLSLGIHHLWRKATVKESRAVSGMHVGIIMGFIIWLTGLVKRNTRIWKVIKTVTIISITLLFIVITGATPSVQRAGLLFIILYLTKDNPDTNRGIPIHVQ